MSNDFGGVRVLILLPVIILALSILVWALVDVIRRPESRMRYLPKWGWLLVVLLGNTMGQLIYLIVGRDNTKQAPVAEGTVSAEKAADAADLLYGRREEDAR